MVQRRSKTEVASSARRLRLALGSGVVVSVMCALVPAWATVARPAAAPASDSSEAARLPGSASSDVRRFVGWVAASGDNARMPFIVVDKVNATVFVFDGAGRLMGAEPALLGMTPGDTTAAHVGKQALANIRPEDRTTPAGRFVASLDRDLQGQTILWIDYDNALAMHRVAKGKPSERRAERLRSPTPTDNRISYGCINVPVPFFEGVVTPAFNDTAGVVYILPELTSASAVFGAYGIDAAPGPDAP